MSKILVRPGDLRQLSGKMQNANTLNLDQIKNRIASSKSSNEIMAGRKDIRHRLLYDSMFDQVDSAGLTELVTSFVNSYNRIEENESPLNQATNWEQPVSMEDRFLKWNPHLSGIPRSDIRWEVDGQSWSGDRKLQRYYFMVVSTIRLALAGVRQHINEFETTHTKSYTRSEYTPSISGAAANAFASVLNHAVDYAIETTEGIDGRSGESDGIVASVRNVLDVAGRNIEIAYAKGDELASQVEALAANEEAFDKEAENLFFSGVIQHFSLLINSSVELKIFRPDLLKDGKGLRNARSEQHEERYTTLMTELTRNLAAVADFIMHPGATSSIPTLITDALNAIDDWEDEALNRVVTVEVREDTGETKQVEMWAMGTRTEVERPIREWVSRGVERSTLCGYLPGNMAQQIASAKTILEDWYDAFDKTINLACDFIGGLGSVVLDELTKDTIYETQSFERLQSFADDAIAGLRSQASVYNNCAAFVREHMSGQVTEACSFALQRGANYFLAIAQTIETDFRYGGPEGRDKTNSFETLGITTSLWAGKSPAEMLEALGVDPITGELAQPVCDDVWEYLEYLLSLSYHSLTDEMWMALAVVYTQLDAGEIGDPNDLTRFIHLLAIENELTGIDQHPPRTEWILCSDRLLRLEQSVDALGAIAEGRGIYVRAMSENDFREKFSDEEWARLEEAFRAEHPDLEMTPRALRFYFAESRYGEQQRELLSRSVLLATLGTLEDFSWSEPPQVLSGNLTGERGASAPALSIVQDSNGGFNLTFTKQRITTTSTQFGTSVRTDVLHEQTMWISAGLVPEDLGAQLIRETRRGHEDLFAFDLYGHVQKEAVNFGVGLIPFSDAVGTAVSLVGPILDIPLGQSEAAVNLSTAQAMTDNLVLGHLAAALNLNAVLVCDGRGAIRVVLRPTATSQAALDHLNNSQTPPTDFELDDLFDGSIANDIFDEFWPDLREGQQ